MLIGDSEGDRQDTLMGKPPGFIPFPPNPAARSLQGQRHINIVSLTICCPSPELVKILRTPPSQYDPLLLVWRPTATICLTYLPTPQLSNIQYPQAHKSQLINAQSSMLHDTHCLLKDCNILYHSPTQPSLNYSPSTPLVSPSPQVQSNRR